MEHKGRPSYHNDARVVVVVVGEKGQSSWEEIKPVVLSILEVCYV